MDSIMVRGAKQSDDRLAIAQCLYLTDPYIYTGAFGEDPRNAALAIESLMSIENGLFSLDNMAVAVTDNQICGVALINHGGAKWDYAECEKKVHGVVPNIDHFEYVSKHYFSAEACSPGDETIEVVACCVMPEYRNMGIGRKMLNWLIQQYPNERMQLDVLTSNSAAINLYQNCGFVIDHSHLGFSMDERCRPECYQMVRHKRVK